MIAANIQKNGAYDRSGDADGEMCQQSFFSEAGKWVRLCGPSIGMSIFISGISAAKAQAASFIAPLDSVLGAMHHKLHVVSLLAEAAMRVFLFFLFYALLSCSIALADGNQAKAPAGHSTPGGSGDPKCCSNDFVNKLLAKAKGGGGGDGVCCTQDDIIHILEAQKNSLLQQQKKTDKIDQAIKVLKDSKD